MYVYMYMYVHVLASLALENLGVYWADNAIMESPDTTITVEWS